MLLIITLLLASLFFYVKYHFVNLCKLNIFFKILLTIILFLGVFNIPIGLLLRHWIPFYATIFLSFSNLLLIYFFTATLLLDITKIFFHKKFHFAYFILAIILPIIAGYACFNSFKFPIIKNITINSANENLKNLKIVVLSDLHVTKYVKRSKIKKIVNTINKLAPDFIYIIGDSVDDTPNNISKILLPIKNIKAPIYMVFGNHEYYHAPYEWEKFFKSLNINILNNSSVILKNNNYNFILGGANFGPHYNDKQASQNNIINKIFKNSEDSNSLPKILLSHYPKTFNNAVKENIFLQISGHTHGGITFPISFITKLFNDGYLRGMYKKENSYLYVSDGTSLWNGMSARLGSQNEITVITIKNH